MPRFAANLSMMFTEVPFLDRFEAAAKAGFTAVEERDFSEHHGKIGGEAGHLTSSCWSANSVRRANACR